MIDKFREVFGSFRFWMSVLGAVIIVLGNYGLIPADIAGVIAGWLGVGIMVRTADRIGQ